MYIYFIKREISSWQNSNTKLLSGDRANSIYNTKYLRDNTTIGNFIVRTGHKFRIGGLTKKHGCKLH